MTSLASLDKVPYLFPLNRYHLRTSKSVFSMFSQASDMYLSTSFFSSTKSFAALFITNLETRLRDKLEVGLSLLEEPPLSWTFLPFVFYPSWILLTIKNQMIPQRTCPTVPSPTSIISPTIVVRTPNIFIFCISYNSEVFSYIRNFLFFLFPKHDCGIGGRDIALFSKFVVGGVSSIISISLYMSMFIIFFPIYHKEE